MLCFRRPFDTNLWAQSTEERLAGMEQALKQIDKRIEDLRTDMNARFSAVDTRITALENEMENRLAALESKTDSRLSAIELTILQADEPDTTD